MTPSRAHTDPLCRQASIADPFARNRRVSPAASSCGIVRRVTIVPVSMRSSRTWSVPVCSMVRSMYAEPPEPACCKRTYRRRELPVPASVAKRAHASASGPYCVVFRQAVQVVVRVHASWFELTTRPVSVEPITPFDQRVPSESGFSFARLNESRTGSGSDGDTRSVGVACASLESGPSPFPFSADTL